ncbi:KilA-N domain-containing protein [Comamonas aquatica]|uniref:KilA-N domain-containing protein n=1 Tax=Comamonas aquatica TaxID=225991 RepID=UPI002447C8E4|nr:KilA-N domain-containing protein [Comamonas aquatica]MDH0900738.1 KilA-N domain-containing protein [Comamonas aquatica]
MKNSTALTVAGTSVRQLDNLYSLNDLHKAAGGEPKHQPGKFSSLEQTKALIAEIGNSPDSESLKITNGRNGGTYACKELVIAYAAWISAAFHLKVIRVFLDAVQPAAPAIDYARINPAQKQDLREIVQAIVDAGVQKHAETWARFQKKFRINSYEELPASRYEEARVYLISKLPNGYAGEVVSEAPAPQMSLDDAVRLDMAFNLATQAAAQMQREVFKGVMAGDASWKHGRLMLSFDATGEGGLVSNVKPIDQNAYVMPLERFHCAVEDALFVDAPTLAKLVSVCTTRLSRMAARGPGGALA